VWPEVPDRFDLADQRGPGENAAEKRIVGGLRGRAADRTGAVVGDVVGVLGEAGAVCGCVVVAPRREQSGEESLDAGVVFGEDVDVLCVSRWMATVVEAGVILSPSAKSPGLSGPRESSRLSRARSVRFTPSRAAAAAS
jgi:hypothetical protein